METKTALSSKTIIINATIMAAYNVAKAAWPDLNIPQDALINIMALANMLLRLVTNSSIKS